MDWKKSIVMLAAAGCAGAAHAEGLTLGTGFDYTSGKYTGTDETQILYVPFIAKYETGAWALRATVPYIRITGPGNVVGAGADRVVLSDGSSRRRTESGLGDIVLSAFYNVLSERSSAIGLDVGAKLKLGTADEERGLGTGKEDWSLQADLFKPIGALTLFGSLGHRWYGEPAGIELKNVTYWSLAAASRLSAQTSAGLAYDYRPAITTGGGKISELTAFVTWRLSREWKLQPYAVAGFGDASPDWGAGAQVAYSY
jgi:hypothetical protein